MKRLPSQERLRQLFDYDERRGVLIWRHRPDVSRCWNTRFAGTVAGYVKGTGYVQVGVDGTGFFAHRIIWKMLFNEEPCKIDHRNGCRSDNRKLNLREATNPQNSMNSLRKRCLPKGVTFRADINRYQAQITLGKKNNYLGCFDTPEEAHAAYVAAAKVHSGEFARFS